MNRNSSALPDALDPVIDAVLSASRVLVAVAARSLADVAEEVTLTQYRTLVVLASRGPQNLAGLADAVGVTPATATRMCDRLVRKDLVRRRTERDDRRQLRVALTTKGRSLVDAVTERRRREIGRIVREIPVEEQVVLVHALGRLTSAGGEVPEQEWTTGWDL
jgi:DNA-binding MarR family transcriptional regulator